MKDLRWLAGVVILALALDVLGIGWGLPHPSADWAIDGLTPLAPLACAWRVVHGEGWWSKYPPFHLLVLAAVQAPYAAWLKLSGQLHTIAQAYPYGLAHPLAALGTLQLLARLVSAAMGAGAALLVALTARELFGRRAAVPAGVAFLASPVTVYYGHTTNLDVPYTFWVSLAFWLAVRIARGDATLGTHVLLGAAAALAIATKDQAYACFALVPIPLLWRRWRAGRLVDRRPIAALIAFGAVYGVASLLLIDPASYVAHARHVTGPGSIPYRAFPRSAAGVLALVLYAGYLTALALGWPMAIACVVGLGLAAVRPSAGTEVLLVGALSYLLTFILPILYVVPRFVLPLVLVAAPFAGLSLSRLWGDGRSHALVRRAGVVALLLVSIGYGATMDARLLTDARYRAEAWLRKHPPRDAVGTDADPSYLPRLDPAWRVVRVAVTPAGIDFGGAEPPELIIMSSARYRVYSRPRRRAQRRVFVALLRGQLGYERVAHFQSARVPGPRLVEGVSPRIVVLRRRAAAGPA